MMDSTFKMKKEKWPTVQFKIIYRLILLSTPVICRWTVPLRYMMTKLAPVSDFIIVCTRTQMIVKDLLDQSRLIQLLFRRCGWFYAPLVMVSL